VATLVVFLVIGLVLGVLVRALRQPGLALALVMCSFGIEQVLAANSEFWGANASAWNFALASSIGVVLSWAFFSGRYRFLGMFAPAQVTMLAFFVFFTWSTEWSPIGSASSVAWANVPYVLLYVIAAAPLMQSGRDGVLALRGAWFIAAGICLYILIDRSVWDENQTRLALRVVADSKRQSNPLALGDVGALAFVIGSLLPGLGEWREGRTWLRYCGIALSLYVTARSARGETLGAVISVIVVFLLPRAEDSTRGRGWPVLGFLSLSGLAAFVLSRVLDTASGQRYSSTTVGNDMSLRFDAVTAMFNAYSNDPDSWLRGLGADYSQYSLGGYPHNQAVQALTETGIIGFGLWIGGPILAVYALYRAWTVIRRSDDLRFAAQVYLALVVYFLVVSTKRGHCLDVVGWMSIVLLERFAMVVLAGERAASKEATPQLARPLHLRVQDR
jgi:O-antigen ligase